MTLRAVDLKRAAGVSPDDAQPFETAVLAHDERHVRRKAIPLGGGDKVLVDFAEAVMLDDGDVLVLDDGRCLAIVAAREPLMEIRPRDFLHLAELCWHIGNRHLAAQIEKDRILVLRDHVIKSMLEGLGAQVTEVNEPFHPLRGAYHGHSHRQDQGRRHTHHHDHAPEP